MKKMIYPLICLQMLFVQSGIYAEEAENGRPSTDQGLWQTVMMIAVAMLFFYLILWRPEQKRRKAAEEQRNALKKGDRVNALGILGTVVRIQEQSVILQMYDGSKIEVLKAAINEILPVTEEEPKKIANEEKENDV